jgi:hypothetical protein
VNGLLILASIATVEPSVATLALTKWRECVDNVSFKLTEEIGQTPYTPERRSLAKAISRVAVARCEYLWGWELNDLNKHKEHRIALRRAEKMAEERFQDYDLEGL